MESCFLLDLISNDNLFCLDIVLCCTLSLLVIVLIYFLSKRFLTVISISSLLVLTILSFSFGLELTGLILLAILIVVLVIFMFVNISEVRHLLIKPQHKKNKDTAKYKKDELYQVIDETVHSLSRSKTGAIMTFERSTNLDDVIKSGTPLNAPVSQELLETIFYEGTRLHDGAVVIRDNMIIAASVYYTPTTRALTGKYGSRHRAAFGISEISDSITVVVSEETGRVSIAYNGNLEAVNLDSFLREFTDLMNLGK